VAQTANEARPRRPRLQYILLIGFILISTIPVLFLATWVQKRAFDNEVAAAEEKHLLLARHLTGALSRYVTDVESVFRVAAQSLVQNQSFKPGDHLLKAVNFEHICHADRDGRIHGISTVIPELVGLSRMAPAMMAALEPDLKKAEQKPGAVIFSRVMPNPNGKPTIYLVRAETDGTFSIGGLATDYIVSAGESIKFGKLGHAAIVDHTGQVIAHPKPSWRAAIKDISKVKPVAMMMAGKTGVTTFYSPAVQAEMIAGFTSVPRVGWGAMIPQPLSELEDRASGVRALVLIVATVGIAAAGFISWWLARYLAGPMQAVVFAAGDFAAGRHDTRVRLSHSFVPKEVHDLVNSFNIMADQVSLNTERLKDAQRIAGLGNWQLDLASGTLWWSEQLHVIFGRADTGDDLEMDRFIASVIAEDRGKVSQAIEAARHDGEGSSLDFRVRRLDGEIRTVHQLIVVDRGADGSPKRVGATILDITERKRSEAAVLASKEEAEIANRSKSEFLASMSHELRMPLNAVLGFSQMLGLDPANPLTPAQNEHVGHILNGGKHLLELINEILDLAQIEADQIRLELEKVNANEIVADCIAMSVPLGNPRRIEIENRFSKQPATHLRTDRVRFKQALINLVSNAVKYNKEDGRVIVEGWETENGFLHLSVTDTGVGIRHEDYPSVFQMFQRIGANPEVAREGTGIGLTVTKHLIDRMAGRVGFESEEGIGSTFWLELPLACNEEVLIWTDAMRVGIDDIDKDHQTLISLVNRTSIETATDTAIDGLIDELIAYTDYHFKREETIMEVCANPGLEEHARQHREFRDKINAFAIEWRDDRDPKSLKRLRRYLTNWLFEHVINVDRDVVLNIRGKEKKIRKALEAIT